MRRRRPLRRDLATAVVLGSVVAIALCAVGVIQVWRGAQRPPDILVVTLCSWRLERIGAYGGAPDVTPVFDGLAARGVRFSRAWSNGVYTNVAHAALLTGRLPEANGLVDVSDELPTSLPVLPEVLRLYGYHTLAWTTIASPVSFRPADGLDRGFDQFLDAERDGRPEFAALPKPWFVLAHIKDAHLPYTTGALPSDEDDPVVHAWLERIRTGEPRDENPDVWIATQFPTAPHARETLVARYDRALHAADARLGKLMARLGSALDDTVVVVVGDHGEALGEGGHIGHGELQPEVAHVPLIVLAPGVAPGVVDEDVSLVDLLPTLTTRVGATVPARLDGRDLGPALDGTRLAPRPAVVQALTRPGSVAHPLGADAFALGDAWVECSREGPCAGMQRVGGVWQESAVDEALRTAGKALLPDAAQLTPGAELTDAQRSAMREAGYWSTP